MVLISLLGQSITPPGLLHPFVRAVLFPPPPALALFYEPEGGACMEPMITQGFDLWQPFRELLHPYTSIASFLFQLYISNTKIEAVVLPERSPPGEFLFIGNYVIASDNVVLIS